MRAPRDKAGRRWQGSRQGRGGIRGTSLLLRKVREKRETCRTMLCATARNHRNSRKESRIVRAKGENLNVRDTYVPCLPKISSRQTCIGLFSTISEPTFKTSSLTCGQKRSAFLAGVCPGVYQHTSSSLCAINVQVSIHLLILSNKSCSRRATGSHTRMTPARPAEHMASISTTRTLPSRGLTSKTIPTPNDSEGFLTLRMLGRQQNLILFRGDRSEHRHKSLCNQRDGADKRYLA